MCLIISVLLAALGINFYLNGFYMQAALMAILSLGFTALLIRNVRCRKNACGLKKDKNKENEENAPDSLNHIHLDQQKVENK